MRLGNQGFVRLLSPEVSKKSVKSFVSQLQFKNGNVQKIRVNNNRNNGFLGIILYRCNISTNNNNNNRTNNNNSITKLQQTLRMNRKKINQNMLRMYPNFNKTRNTVHGNTLALQKLQMLNVGNIRRTRKMPMGFNGNNYYNYLKSKN